MSSVDFPWFRIADEIKKSVRRTFTYILCHLLSIGFRSVLNVFFIALKLLRRLVLVFKNNQHFNRHEIITIALGSNCSGERLPRVEAAININSVLKYNRLIYPVHRVLLYKSFTILKCIKADVVDIFWSDIKRKQGDKGDEKVFHDWFMFIK